MTRRNPEAEELLALPDEDEQEEGEHNEGDITVEICDENGAMVESGGQELAQEDDWEDEDAEEQAEDGRALDTAARPTTDNAAAPEVDIGGSDAVDDDAASPFMNEPSVPQSIVEEAQDSIREMASGRSASSQNVPLPDGFVSPAKRSVIQQRRTKASLDSRRRTLPVQFAPTLLPNPVGTTSHSGESISTVSPDNAEMYNTVAQDLGLVTDLEHESKPNESDAEQGWEDIEDEVPMSTDAHSGPIPYSDVDEDMASDDAAGSPEAPYTDEGGTDGDQACDNAAIHTNIAALRDGHDNARLSSSPIPTIEGQHPRLPLRRSPRRQSSSPLKKSVLLPSRNASHLVAFTPIKGLSTSSFSGGHTDLGVAVVEPDDAQLSPSSPVERAASAPPEEPQMSPQKPAKPRVSDDTALLQAFLNRAAESKSSRKVSATKRESISNRRDSDTIRQALASPAKADVLGDLDPNSPIPR